MENWSELVWDETYRVLLSDREPKNKVNKVRFEKIK